MALHITSAALSRIQKLVARAQAKRPVVCVSWDRHQADNKRGPSGETIWTRVSDDRWDVFVLDYDRPELALEDFPTVKVEGIEFSHPILDGYGRPIKEPILDCEGELFVVRASAI